MKKKKWSRIAAVGAVLFILAFGAACGDDKKNTEKNEKETSRFREVSSFPSYGLAEVSVQQALECLSVSGFVSGHFVDGVMQRIQAQFLALLR